MQNCDLFTTVQLKKITASAHNYTNNNYRSIPALRSLMINTALVSKVLLGFAYFPVEDRINDEDDYYKE